MDHDAGQSALCCCFEYDAVTVPDQPGRHHVEEGIHLHMQQWPGCDLLQGARHAAFADTANAVQDDDLRAHHGNGTAAIGPRSHPRIRLA